MTHPRAPRSIALVGPYGSGKSTLFEMLLTDAGSPPKRPDQRNRPMTTDLRLGHCTYLGEAWSILDCPGSVEFGYEAAVALAVVDLAVVVCEPAPERALTVAPLLKLLEEGGIPHLIFVNKIDTLAGRVGDTLHALQDQSSRPLVLRQFPIRDRERVTGYVDVVSERAYRYRKGEPSELIQLPPHMADREKDAFAGLVEVLADHDDRLLEKLLEDIVPSTEEVYRQLHADQVEGAIVEVLLGAAERDHGVRRLWKALRHDVPEPSHTAKRRGVAPEGGPLVQVFKTIHAAHAGKLSYARVWHGPLHDGAHLNGGRVGSLWRMPAGDAVKVTQVGDGELVALGRLEEAATGMVLGGESGPVLPFPTPPTPVYALAIMVPDRKDDVRLSAALQKMTEEDRTLAVIHDPETGETRLEGQGEIHLHAIIERLSRIHHLAVTARKPELAYRETIRKSVKEHARLKRQTGGHGQFADVKLEIEPRGRGDGFLFVDRIVGGAVPRQYIPAVAEAAEEAMRKGPFGYPVVDIAVTLVDGTYHAVDSSDMAFRNATRAGIAEALAKADPILLEPIDRVTVTVPDAFTPSAQRLLSGRRGQILGFAARPDWPGWDEVEALVPQAELHDLIIELRSQTLGLGTFRRCPDHLAELRGKIIERN